MIEAKQPEVAGLARAGSQEVPHSSFGLKAFSCGGVDLIFGPAELAWDLGVVLAEPR